MWTVETSAGLIKKHDFMFLYFFYIFPPPQTVLSEAELLIRSAHGRRISSDEPRQGRKTSRRSHGTDLFRIKKWNLCLSLVRAKRSGAMAMAGITFRPVHHKSLLFAWKSES